MQVRGGNYFGAAGEKIISTAYRHVYILLRDNSSINHDAAINSSDEDDRQLVPKLSQHRLSSSKACEPEPIADSSSRGFILGKHTAAINKFITAYTISIVGRVFHSSEANHVRDEALCLAALTLNIFASADEYEQHIREHPALRVRAVEKEK